MRLKDGLCNKCVPYFSYLSVVMVVQKLLKSVTN